MRKKLSGLGREYWFNQIGVTERELDHGAVKRQDVFLLIAFRRKLYNQ